MSTKPNLHESYIGKINKAIDYIRDNLDKPLKLDDIARKANFSKYHFHRIFSSMMEETLNNFVKRLRLEKAASKLIYDDRVNITDVALENGFSSSQTFARAFKEYFATTPSKYRKNKKLKSKNRNIKSKNYHLESKKWKDSDYKVKYITSNGRPKIIYKSIAMNTKVEVKELDEVTVAYIRHKGPYKGDAELFGRLFTQISEWAGTRNLLKKDTNMYSVYYEDSDVTDDQKAMVDVCVSVPEDTKVDGEIGKQTLPGGKYAVARFEIEDPEDYGKAWNSIYKDWLPQSGYLPNEGPAFERYPSDCATEEGGQIVEICVPVKAAK